MDIAEESSSVLNQSYYRLYYYDKFLALLFFRCHFDCMDLRM